MQRDTHGTNSKMVVGVGAECLLLVACTVLMCLAWILDCCCAHAACPKIPGTRRQCSDKKQLLGRQAAARLGTRPPTPTREFSMTSTEQLLVSFNKESPGLAGCCVCSGVHAMSAAKSNSCLPQVATPATYYHKLCLQPPLNQK